MRVGVALGEFAIDHDPAPRLRLALYPVQQHCLAHTPQPSDEHVARVPRVLKEAADRLDLLLAVTQVRRVDTVPGTVRSGGPDCRHLIANDKACDLSFRIPQTVPSCANICSLWGRGRRISGSTVP